MSTTKRILGGAAAFGIACSIAAVAPATASAAPVACTTAPGGAAAAEIVGGSQCDSTADGSSAAAGFGLEGWGSAEALNNAAALALGINGGTAVSVGELGGAPAAIAIGPAALAQNSAAGLGLSLAIAGPGATVTLTPTGAVCTGPSIAGSFTTLQGCVG